MNLQQEIVQLLKDFPATVVEGKSFDAYMDDLADDIQAKVIKALAQYNPPRPSVYEVDPELEHRLDMLTNSHFGVALHNMVFLTGHRPAGVVPGPVVRAMLRVFLLEKAK